MLFQRPSELQAFLAANALLGQSERYRTASLAECYYQSLQYQQLQPWDAQVALKHRQPRIVVPLFREAVDGIEDLKAAGAQGRFLRHYEECTAAAAESALLAVSGSDLVLLAVPVAQREAALALGATAVGVGRPYAYGMALGGQAGVQHVLQCLLAETDLIMAVDGYGSITELTPDCLRRVD